MNNKELEKQLNEIKKRNQRVELDKKWETSYTRRIIIMFITYLVVVIYSIMIQKIGSIWLSSLVPVIGFLLSTLSLKMIRKIWEKKNE